MFSQSMKKIYYYPSAPKEGYANPYSQNYKSALSSYFEILDSSKHPFHMQGLLLLKYSLVADVFILNWIESIIFLHWGRLQTLLAFLALKIMKIRKKQIVWMLHNIHPHQGKSPTAEKISEWLYKNSSIIISHSKDTAFFAAYKSKCKVQYVCHPTLGKKLPKVQSRKKAKYDVFIWGSILPYKGIYEFISLPSIQSSNLSIYILGHCKDSTLAKSIKEKCNNHIVFENRRADYSEISDCCRTSKYVLFPYIGDCVSSSGALIDTIEFGGIPVGPNKGAFKDLKEHGIAITYDNYEELVPLLERSISIDDKKISNFIEENKWDVFSKTLYDSLTNHFE